jgi:hypothetical protein
MFPSESRNSDLFDVIILLNVNGVGSPWIEADLLCVLALAILDFV